MKTLSGTWRNPDGLQNALAVRAHYSDALKAMEELDRLGHRLLERATKDLEVDRIDPLVGVALIRRSIMLFVAIRHLFEDSLVEPAKLQMRAQFETLLAVRYLAYGGKRDIPLLEPTHTRQRESRARYFYVAAERRKLYARQALLDGRWGRESLGRKARKALRAELVHNLALLDKLFPTQQKAFGPLRCFGTRSKRRYHDPYPWYAFGFRKRDVTGVRQLAKRFGHLRDYEIMYDAFSALTHPRGVSHDLTIDHETGTMEVHHSYAPSSFELLCSWSCLWQQGILIALTKAYHPATLPDAQTVNKRVSKLISDLDASDLGIGFF